MVGNRVEEPDYYPVAIDLVAKCAGLPVAISSVANALKEKNIDIWRNAWQQLKRANPKSIEGIEKSVYSALKLSYEYLQNKPAQTLLLLCSSWPQGQEIFTSDLIRYSWGMDLLEDVCTMEEARVYTTALIQKLKDSSLLLSDMIDTAFRMHDIVHDVCVSIGEEDNQMFVIKEQVRLEKLLKSRKLENCSVISIPYSDIRKLPHVLNCPQLQFFLLYSKDEFFKVPDAFFKETKTLKVLHLGGMKFSTLPSSFLSLTNLQTLCLDHCKLQDIAIIGELRNLEVLSLSKSDIIELPMELENLSMLKLLDLSDCYELNFIPQNLISTLRGLEELYMGNSFDQWDVDDNASLSELKDLVNLTALDVHISDARIIPTNLFSKNLKRYKIFIGEEWMWSGIHERSRILRLKLNTNMHLDHDIAMLLKETEELSLIVALKSVMNVLSLLDSRGTHMKDLSIFNFENREAITEMSSLLVPLFNHKVKLCYLENLELIQINIPRIWDNTASFCSINLKSCTVQECNNLKNLFSTSMARCLTQLKCLIVSQCQSVIEIIAADVEEAGDEILFPNLDSLYLFGLPKLIRFSGNSIDLPSLRVLSISFCEVLESFVSNAATVETLIRGKKRNHSEKDRSSNIPTLFDERVNLPKLERLRIEGVERLRRIWHKQLSPKSFNNINDFSLCHCDRLLNVFPTHQMLGILQRLHHLVIQDCCSMEEIFEHEELNLGKSIAINFELPALTELSLQSLPNLKSFSCKAIECPSLKILNVFHCNQVHLVFCSKEYISSGKTQEDEEIGQQPWFWVNKIGFPGLEELHLESNWNLKQIWKGQLSWQCFPHLKLLSLSSMHELRCVWDEKFEPFRQVFYELTTLDVYDCRSLKNLLVPSSISFSNLVTMTISKCHGLITLLTHSTAKSLVHLTTMSISYCDEIREIIARDGVEDGIIFTQLKSVELKGLRKLEGFCLGNSNIQFLSLDELIVIECPKMRIFCQGELVTPKL